MQTYYVSLVNGLNGYYVKFEAASEDLVRDYAVKYFGRLWCEVYTAAYFFEVLRRRVPKNTRIVNKDRPIVIESYEQI